MKRSRPFATVITVVAAGALAGCISQAITLGSSQPARPGRSYIGRTNSPREPLSSTPISVGSRTLGLTARPHAAMTVIDSIIKDWGWNIEKSSSDTDLRTDWFYLEGPELGPSGGTPCANAAQAALRVWIHPGRTSGDSTEFVALGEALTPTGAGQGEGERIARTSYDQVVDLLTDGVRRSDAQPDSANPLSPTRGSVGVTKTNGARSECATVIR